MTDIADNFNIIFRSGLPARELAFFSHMCGRLTSPAGEDLLVLKCASIDTSHHVYLQVEAIWPGSESTHPIQIPHQFVMLVVGRELPKEIGFSAQRSGL